MTLRIILENITFVISISLQLTAALLLVGKTDIRRDKLILSYLEKHKAIVFDKNDQLLDNSDLQSIVHTTWINRLAFTYLFIGYVVSIFASCSICKMCMLFIILAFTPVVYILSDKYAKSKSESFKSLRFEDLPRSKGTMILRHPKK